MATAAFYWEWNSVIAFWETRVTSLCIKILIHSVTTLLIHHIRSIAAVTHCTSHTPTCIWKYRCTLSSTARYEWCIRHLQKQKFYSFALQKSSYIRFKVMRDTKWVFLVCSQPTLFLVSQQFTYYQQTRDYLMTCTYYTADRRLTVSACGDLCFTTTASLSSWIFHVYRTFPWQPLKHTATHSGWALSSYFWVFPLCLCHLFVFHTQCKSFFFSFSHSLNVCMIPDRCCII